jgi:hypothetical protein
MQLGMVLNPVDTDTSCTSVLSHSYSHLRCTVVRIPVCHITICLLGEVSFDKEGDFNEIVKSFSEYIGSGRMVFHFSW